MTLHRQFLGWFLTGCCAGVGRPAARSASDPDAGTHRHHGHDSRRGAGAITIADDAGRELACKIQEKGERGVSLAGAKAVVDFPAKVQVTGKLGREALAKGALVRFSAPLNRLGRTDGAVKEIAVFDEGRYPLGLKPDGEPAERGGSVPCTLTAEVFAAYANRVVIVTPS